MRLQKSKLPIPTNTNENGDFAPNHKLEEQDTLC